MLQTTLFLRRPEETVGFGPSEDPPPLGRLLLAAVFAASSALAFAAVVILGTPNAGPPTASSTPLQASAPGDASNLPLRP